MKRNNKVLFFLLLVLLFIFPGRVLAACTKKSGIIVACGGSQKIQCLVAGDFYCCDTQEACDAQKNQGNGAACKTGEGGKDQPCCGGQGGSCNPGLTCTYVAVPSGNIAKTAYYCLTTEEIQKYTNTNYSPCGLVTDATQKSDCTDCANGTGKYSGQSPGIWTAIGCITTDPNNLLSNILRFALGIAGGIAFLLILFGGLQIMTSAGNPEQLNGGRELITSAIIGLILVLFSVFLLQFIGINIIGIPGFTNPSSIPNALSRP